MEDAIRVNEGNFDILFYRNPQPMLIFDIDSLQIIEVNDAAIAHYGYTSAEFKQLTTRNLRVKNEREDFDLLIPRFRESENVYAEAQHYLKSGKTCTVQIISYVIEYRGKICRLAHIHDITAKVKQAKNFEILISIGKSISEGLDLHTVLQRVTDASTQISGAEIGAFFYNTKNEDGQDIMLYCISGQENQKHNKLGVIRNERFQSALYRSQILRIDDISQFPDRAQIEPLYSMINSYVKASSCLTIPVISKERLVNGCVMLGHSLPGAFTDEAQKMVTGVVSQATIALDNASLFARVVKANKENEELLLKAQEKNFKKDEFLSIASHELKTPVTSMKGYLQLLQRQAQRDNNSFYTGLLDKANKQVNKITRLVGDLLNVSKIESGKMEYNFSQFSVGTLLDDCIANFKSGKNSHVIRIFGDRQVTVYGDESRIEQVVINLIDNAIKYSPKANEVLIGVSRQGDYLKVDVRDFGPGIPEEKLPFIFERFYRGEENSFTTSGLGLGLYISSEIIKRHNGRMGAESELGKGSTFWFVIPVHNSEQ